MSYMIIRLFCSDVIVLSLGTTRFCKPPWGRSGVFPERVASLNVSHTKTRIKGLEGSRRPKRGNVFLLLGHLFLGLVSQVFMVLLGSEEENRASRRQEVKELLSSETP